MPATNVFTAAQQGGLTPGPATGAVNTGGDWFSQQQIYTGTPPGGYNPYEATDQPGTYREGDWEITTRGIGGNDYRRNLKTGETQNYDQTSRQWVTGPLPPRAAERDAYLQQQQQQTGTPGGTAPTSGADPYAIMRQASQGLPPTAESLDQIVEALRAQGIPAAKATHANNSLASDDVIVLPDGTEIDAINDVGGAGAKWGAFSPTGQYDPNRSVVGPGGQLVKFSDYLQQQGRPVPQAGQGGMTPLSSVGGGAAGQEAALMSAPGFQFRIAEGQKALERSAAARGTLLTGGTLKGITRYSQDFASNEYNNRYNQLYGLSQLGLNAAGQSGNLYASQGAANADLITAGANSGAAGTIGAGNANAGAISNTGSSIQELLYLEQLRRMGAGNGTPYPGYPGTYPGYPGTPPYFPPGTTGLPK